MDSKPEPAVSAPDAPIQRSAADVAPVISEPVRERPRLEDELPAASVIDDHLEKLSEMNADENVAAVHIIEQSPTQPDVLLAEALAAESSDLLHIPETSEQIAPQKSSSGNAEPAIDVDASLRAYESIVSAAEDSEASGGVTSTGDAAELRQLLGIDAGHQVEGGSDAQRQMNANGTELELPAEAMEIRRAFLAAGHAGGLLLEDLIALDGELEERLTGDDYADIRSGIDELQPEDVMSSEMIMANVGEDGPTILLPEVRPDIFATDMQIENQTVNSIDTPIERAGALREALQSLDSTQVTMVEVFLARAGRAVERLGRLPETDEDGRASIEHGLEAWCEQLFDALGIDHNDELTRHFVDCIVSPETASITQDGALSSLDIALLNYLGTHEYKGDQQASLLKSIIQAVQDWLHHQRRLGRCALKLVRDTFIMDPGLSVSSA